MTAQSVNGGGNHTMTKAGDDFGRVRIDDSSSSTALHKHNRVGDDQLDHNAKRSAYDAFDEQIQGGAGPTKSVKMGNT